MTMLAQIEKEKQTIARCKKSLAVEKIKKRRADTRYKIELGGLVIKSSMDRYDKGIILGALAHVFHLINENQDYSNLLAIICFWKTGTPRKLIIRDKLRMFL